MCERIFAGLDSDCNNCLNSGTGYTGFCATCILCDYAKCTRCDAIVPVASGFIDCQDFFCPDCQGVICSSCGNFVGEKSVEIDGALFCGACCTECPDCGVLHRYDDSIENRCEDCSNEVFYCERCSDYEPNDEAVTVHMGYRHDETWCRYCADHYATACNDCGDYWADDSDIYRDSTGRAYCPRCMEERGVCEDCGACLPWDSLYYRESREAHYCGSCDPGEEEDKPGNLHLYDWTPNRLCFHGYGPVYAGIELEVEAQDQEETCEIVRGLDPYEKVFWCKEDGSLSSKGVEIVGHPMDWQCTQDNWLKLLEKLKGKAKSHDTNTCGLHVHVTRAAYSVDTWEHVCLFVDLHWPRFVALARRESEHYAKRLPSNNPCRCMEKGVGRYWALNFSNENTVEWRLWRGALKPDTFFACVACSLALPEYIAQADDIYGWYGFMSYCADNGYSVVSNYFNK